MGRNLPDAADDDARGRETPLVLDLHAQTKGDPGQFVDIQPDAQQFLKPPDG
jgi:hypothetical protein